jgi:toxin HigB-1
MGFSNSCERGFRLELAFSTLSLRIICEDEAHAKNELGTNVAEILKRRLADLRAASSVKDLVAGQPRQLDNKNDQCMAIDLCDGFWIVFTANHTRNPKNRIGELDWLKINRVIILRIERNHG